MPPFRSRLGSPKAAFVTLVHTILFGFVASQVSDFAKVDGATRTVGFWVGVVILVAYIYVTLKAIHYAIKCVIPDTGDDAPTCRIHFAHVLTTYGADHGRYCREIIALDDCAWANEVGSQIVVNSRIADTKHRRAKDSLHWTVKAIVLWGILLIVVPFALPTEASSASQSTAAPSQPAAAP